MEKYTRQSLITTLFGGSISCARRFLFRVLSMGPIPAHMAFILDGNRRYAKKRDIPEVIGYRAGFLSLMSLLKCCYELGVNYVTIYSFSIDNFKRRSEEVQSLMDLMLEKIEGLLKEESIVNQYGVRVYFIGNLKLLSDGGGNSFHEVKLEDVERRMYMSVAPDPDILIRTSGEMRLSNFLLWLMSNCLLYSPRALWPEIGLRHLVWAVLNFQRVKPYMESNKAKEM